MEQSLLVELIRTLKSEEKVQILHFAEVPFFNNGPMKAHVVPLLAICLNHSWHLSEQRLEKQQVYATVFPKQSFVEGKIEKLMVEAHRVIRQFLLVQRYFRAENEFNQLFDFSAEVHERKLPNRYQQTIAKLQKIQEVGPQNSLSFYHRQFLLEFSKFEEETVRNQGKGDLNIPQTIRALQLDYYLNLLILINQYLLQLKIAHIEVPINISHLIEANPMPEFCIEESITVRINHEVFKLLKKQSLNAADVQDLFDLLLLFENDLEPKTLSDCYAFLRNLCVLTISADYEKIEMAWTLHELYKDNLHRGFLHFDGTISRSKYMAVANNALLIEEYDWALSFIERYKHELQGENKTKDLYRLNLANYLFRVGRHSDCLDNIPDSSPFVFYLLQGKRLELKSLYELRSDLLPYKLDAFKMFLSRTSTKLLSASKKQNHSDFANLLHQLVNSKSGDHKRCDQLIKRILNKKQSAEWRWLLEKAKGLKEG